MNLGTEIWNLEHINGFLQNENQVNLSQTSISQIEKSHQNVEKILKSGQTVYGINTGFGPLCDTKISDEQTRKLQENLLISHAVGVGKPIDKSISKLMLVTKAHALSKGFSGISLQVVERILWHIEEDLIPVVPEQGSVGASGDLAPLAHLFLPLIGEGKIWQNDQEISALEILDKYNKKPLSLGAKEGLALINGTQFILAHAIKGLIEFENLLNAADLIAAISLDAFQGSIHPFDAPLHEIRPFWGTQKVAENLRLILKDSQITFSHPDCGRVQDPYSMRCIPQVHGASRNAWAHLRDLSEIELNSVTDNPIILDEFTAISGGNFHGQPLAMALDYATLAASEIGNISDRRSYLLLEGKYGLPKLLTDSPGLNSGFMIPQYTTAALCTENKTLCFPASADSIPTSLGQEDHVSMGSISGRKFNQVLGNVQKILAIELMYACQALEYRRPSKSGYLVEKTFDLVREKVAKLGDDRLIGKDIETIVVLMQDDAFKSILKEVKNLAK